MGKTEIVNKLIKENPEKYKRLLNVYMEKQGKSKVVASRLAKEIMLIDFIVEKIFNKPNIKL